MSFEPGDHKYDNGALMFKNVNGLREMTVTNILRMDLEALHITVDNLAFEQGVAITLNALQEEALLDFLLRRREIADAHEDNAQLDYARAQRKKYEAIEKRITQGGII